MSSTRPTRMSLLADMLGTLIDRRIVPGRGARDTRPLKDLVGDLLGSPGEVSGYALACAILDRFEASDDAGKRTFFEILARDLDIVPDDLHARLDEYADARDLDSYRALMAAAEPARQELIRRLNQVPGATARLVAMRADLLRLAKGDPALSRIDLDFRHLFTSWFNRGFLMLRQVTWSSPASLLEDIINYEAVHAIDSWAALRARVQPGDRRCFGFFHPAMPDAPLIFVEVALMRGIPGAIGTILDEDRRELDPAEADTAVFYSISNCQAGLAGISFGHSLISQVVRDLSVELPQLKTFVTLSPIPGLMGWLEETGRAFPDDPAAQRHLAAHYLQSVKGRAGCPRDPVARFHLRNGATLHEVHAGADTSADALAQSGGAMVNYLYDPKRISENHEAFAREGRVAATPALRRLAGAPEGD